MPRKSHAESVVTLVAPRVDRLRPPDDLDAKAAAMFRNVVASCPANHFALGDVHVVTAFVQAVQISRQSAGDPALIAQWEKATRLVATLAQRLRLCPSARVDPKTAGRAADRYQPSYYDRMRDENQRRRNS